MELDGETVAVPVGESAENLHAVLNVNEEAMRILELLSEETTEDAVVKKLLTEYVGTEAEIRPQVHNFIEQVRQEGFLEE